MKLLVLGDHAYGAPFRYMFPDAEIVYVNTHKEVAPLQLSDYAAIQFTGGADVNPALYGQANTDARGTCAHRDLWETRIFTNALRAHIPMFGICRGSQFLRVMCGGALIQHIGGHGGDHNAFFSSVNYEAELNITSTHHQASDPEVAPYLFDNFLRARDGTVEGWAAVAYPVSAVQYHPEYMPSTSAGFELYCDVIRSTMDPYAQVRYNINA